MKYLEKNNFLEKYFEVVAEACPHGNKIQLLEKSKENADVICLQYCIAFSRTLDKEGKNIEGEIWEQRNNLRSAVESFAICYSWLLNENVKIKG